MSPALENSGASATTRDLHKHSSGANPLGPCLPRAELVCDGESQPLCCPGSGMTCQAASRVTREGFSSSLLLQMCVSTHHPTVCSSRSHTSTIDARAGTDNHTTVRMDALPILCLLKAVNLKQREKESINGGAAISSGYLKSLAFGYFQQISVRLLHTYFCFL